MVGGCGFREVGKLECVDVDVDVSVGCLVVWEGGVI